MNGKINSNIGKSYTITSPSKSSSSIAGGISRINTSVTEQLSNKLQTFSNAVDEMDLSISNELGAIDTSKISDESYMTSLTKNWLEQLRNETNSCITQFQNERNNLENKYKAFFKVNEDANAENISKLTVGVNFAFQDMAIYDPTIYQQNAEEIINISNEQYLAEHLEEFEAYMGMSLEEYKQQIAELDSYIAQLGAYDYYLRQQAKEQPYIEIMETQEFQNYVANLTSSDIEPRMIFSYKDDLAFLTEEQIYMYNYLFDTKGKDEAVVYLEAIEDKINQAKGLAEAEVFISKITDEEGNIDVNLFQTYITTTGKGLGDGIENFGEGLENLFDFTSDGMITDNQYAQMYILQKINELQEKDAMLGILDDTYQVSTSIGNMLPGTVISILTNETVGQLLMGMSAAGNAKNQALIYNSDNIALAYIYGTFNGLSEAVIGKLMGNIPGLNEGAKFAVKDILSEGVEEFYQTYVDVGLKAVIYQEVPDITSFSQEALQSFVYGCITSGIMTGSQTAINLTIGGVKYTYDNLNELINSYKSGELSSLIDTTTSKIDISNKIGRYNELMKIVNTDAYINWYYDEYGARVLPSSPDGFDTSSEFYHIKQELESLNAELIQLANNGIIERGEEVSSDFGYRSYSLNVSQIEVENDRSVNGGVETSNVVPEMNFDIESNIKDTGSILSDIFDKMGNSRGRRILAMYASTGNINHIPSEFRTQLEGISIPDVKKFLNTETFNIGIQYFSNSYETYKAQLLKGIQAMDTKYVSPGFGLARLGEYLRTGNKELLSSAGNFRQSATTMPKDMLTKIYNEIITTKRSNQIVASFKSMSDWYDKVSVNTYGVSQSAIQDLFIYIVDGKKYNYKQLNALIKKAEKKGSKLPKFEKQASTEYFRLKKKLTNMGFSNNDATIILNSINVKGVCSYASVANEIFYNFRNKIALFEKKFGYSYYKNGNENEGLNSAELLLDLYLFANDIENGGNLILASKNHVNVTGNYVDFFGRKLLNVREQFYFSHAITGREDLIIDKFLKSKDSSWSYASGQIDNYLTNIIPNDLAFENLKVSLKSLVSQGYTISLDYFSNPKNNDPAIRMINMDGRDTNYTTATWNEGFGHSVAVTGMTQDGFIISSWGAKFLIPFDDLKGGRAKFNLNISKIDLPN